MEEAIRSGVYWGTVSLISAVTALLKKRLGENTATFLTGGAAAALVPQLPSSFIHLPNLTLEGILWAYDACVS